MKTKVKNVFNINKKVNFVNVDLTGDVQVFIDPIQITSKLTIPGFDSVTARAKIDKFFSTILESYRKGKKRDAVKLFTNSSENNSIGLGYSKGTRNGKGLSPTQVANFFKELYGMVDLGDELLANPTLFSIFMNGFGDDRFTDLAAPLILKELNDYSLNEAKKNSLPISDLELEVGKYWDGQSFRMLKSRCVIYEGTPIILVPWSICVTKYSYTIERFVNGIIFTLKQAEYEADNDGKTITKKDLLKDVRIRDSKKGYFKRYALNEAIDHPDYIEQFLEFIGREGTAAHGHSLMNEDDY